MATAAVIGEALAVEAYALAGVVVYPADSPGEAIAAFDALPAGTALVIMTATAAGWLSERLGQRPDILTAVMRL
jgi:vacuolar-type H+-ATPase subunit F/Vma7